MSNNVFDQSRISKIAKIAPNFFDFAASGDEIQLGMDGDPAFPPTYRGSSRPVGTIQSISGSKGSRICIGRFGGRTMELHEGNTAPGLVWEFTEAGFRGVMDRQQRLKEEREERDSYRGAVSRSRGTAASSDVASVQQELYDLKGQVKNIHDIVVSVADGLSRDIQGMAQKTHEPVFAGALLREMSSYTQKPARGLSHSSRATTDFQFSDDGSDLSD